MCAALKVNNASDEFPYPYHLKEKEKYTQLAIQEMENHDNPLSDDTSDDILRLLLESAFAIGSFEDAYACFFGNQTGK